MKMVFCMQINIKVYCNTFDIKVSYKVDISIINGHDQAFQIAQSNKFAISLQYLKKEVSNRGHFRHADKRRSFYKLVLSFSMEVTRHVQNTQNRKLRIFLQYIKKNGRNCFVFYCDAKHSDILQESSHVRCYLFQFCFNQNYVEVAINDFTRHPIILKWLRIQKCRQTRKTMRQRG